MDEIKILLQAILEKNVSKAEINKQIKQLEKELNGVEVKVKVDDNSLKMQNAIGALEQKRWKENEKFAKAQADAMNKNYELEQAKREQSLNEETKVRSAIRKMQQEQFANQEKLRQKAIEYNNTIKEQIKNTAGKYDLGNLNELKDFENKMKSGLSFKSLEEIPKQIKNSQKELDGITSRLKTSHAQNKKAFEDELTAEKQLIAQAEKELKQREQVLIYEQKVNAELKKIETNKQKQIAQDEKQLQIYRQMASIKFQNLETKYGNLSENKSVTGLKTKIESADFTTGDFSKTNADIKQLEANLRSTAKASKGLGGDLIHAASKFTEFIVMGGLVMGIFNKFQEGAVFIREMAKEMTTLAMETNNTNLSFQETMGTVNKFADDLASTSTEVVKALGIFTTYTSSMEEALTKTKSATIMANISGQSVEQSAEAISASLEQFQMGADESLSVVDKIGGAARNLNIDYGKAISEISSGIGVVGSVAKNSNVSLEETIGLISTIMEKTRDSGKSSAMGLKTIFSRMGNVTEEISPEDFNKLESSFDDVGISLKNMTDGSVKPAMEALGELAGKWDNLTDIERNSVAQSAAGIHQRNKFLALMANWKDVMANTASATMSEGVAMQKQSIYSNSLEASIKRLQNSFEKLYIAAGNTELFKNIVNILTIMIETFANIPTVMGTGIALLIAWKGAAFSASLETKGLMGSIKGLALSFKGLIASMGPIGLIITAITTLITVVSIYKNAQQEAIEKQKQFVDSLQTETEALQKQKEELAKLESEYTTLNSKEKLTTNEKERLVEIQKQLVSQYGASATAVTAEGVAITTSNGAIKERISVIDENIAKNKELLALTVEGSDTKTTDELEKIAKKEKLAWDKIADIRKTAAQKINGKESAWTGEGSLDETKKRLEAEQIVIIQGLQKQKEEISKNRKTLLQDQIKQIESGGVQLTEASRKVANDYAGALAMQGVNYPEQVSKLKDFIGNLSSAGFNELTAQYEKYKKSGDKSGMDDISKAISETVSMAIGDISKLDASAKAPILNFIQAIQGAFGDSSILKSIMETLPDFSYNAEQMAKSVSETTGELKNLNQALYDVEQGESLNGEQVADLLIKYPQLKDSIIRTSEGYTIEQGALEQVRQAYVDNMNTKIASENGMSQAQMAQLQSRLNMYQVEIDAIKDLASAQAAIANISSQVNAEAVAAGEAAGLSEADIQSMEASGQAQVAGLNKQILAFGDIQEKLNAIKNITIDKSFGVSPSRSKGKSEPSTASEVEANEKLILADRYRALNQALEQTNTLLAQNKALQENATAEERIKLLQQEIELQKIKQDNIHNIAEEQRKELAEKQSALTAYGISFDESGNITNLESVSSGQLEGVNAHRTDKNKNQYKALKENYDDFEAVLKRYQELQKEIPEQGIDWLKIQSDINKIEEEKVNIKIEIQDKEFEKVNKRIQSKNDSLENINLQFSGLDATTQKSKIAKQIFNEIDKDIENLLNAMAIETEPKLLENMNEQLEELKSKSKEAIANIKALRLETIEGVLTRDTKSREKFSNKKQEQQNILDFMGEGNFTGRKNAFNEMIKNNKSSVEDLTQKIYVYTTALKNAQNTEEADKWKTAIKEAKQEIADLTLETKSFEESIKSDKTKQLEIKFNKIASTFKVADEQIESLEHSLSMLDEGDEPNKVKITEQIVSKLQARIKYTRGEIVSLQNAMMKTSDQEFITKANEQISAFTDEIRSAETKLKSFRDEAIEKLDEELEKVNEKASKLIEDQIKDIEKKKDTEIKAIEEATKTAKEATEIKIKGIEKEIDALQEQNDLLDEQEERLKKIKDIEKQQTTVSNLEKEKNVQVYKKGQGFVWSVDVKKLKEEKDQLAEMTTEYNNWERNIATKKKIDDLNKLKEEEQAKLEVVEKANEAIIKNIEDTNQAKIDQLNLFQETYNKSVEEDGVTKIESLTTLMNNLKKTEDSSYSERIKGLQQYINDYNAKMASMNSSATGEKVTTSTKETIIPTAPTKYTEKGTSGISQKIAIKKYASGGLNTETGLHYLDGTVQEPERVLSAKQTSLFEKLVNFLPNFDNIKIPQVAVTGIPSGKSENFTLNGDIHVTSNDATAFLDQIKRKFRSS